MGQVMSTKSKLALCAERYNGSHDEVNARNLIQCLQRNEHRDEVVIAQDKSELANCFTLACQRNHVDVLEAFLENGMNVDIADQHGYTALMIASHWSKEECVRLLLTRNANVNAQGMGGSTALMLASRGYDSIEIVNMLLERNADVNAQDVTGNTALMVASQNNANIVEAILNHGADIDVKNIYGRTALYHARNKEIKEMLRNHVGTSYVLK